MYKQLRNSIYRNDDIVNQVHPIASESSNLNRDSVGGRLEEGVSEYDGYKNHANINNNCNLNPNSNINQDSDSDSDVESTSDVCSKSGSMNTNDELEYNKQSQMEFKRFTDNVKKSCTNENIKRFFRWLLEFAYFEIHIAVGVI